jgi:branched-chain amino acid transport system substrate-binding protein
VFVEEVGADAPRFIQQWASSGMKAKYPLISNETTVDQSLLRKMKPQDAEGIISARHFAEGRNDPATQQFDQLWQQKYQVYPSYYAAAMYTAAQWLAQSFNSVNCKISGTDQSHWLDTVRNTKLSDSPFGPEHLDSYNNPVFNVYIAKVEIQSNGTAWNVPIDTIPNVSQFWTVPPAQYLQQQPYSKTFQGNNYHP